MDHSFAEAPVHDAVTAIIEHDGQVLLLRRCENLLAFAGHYAFPGGKIDPGDAALAPPGFESPRPQALGALARELREELGLDLFAPGAGIRIEHLTEVGFALTPPLAPRRYAVRFFRLRLRSRPRLSIDTREHDAFAWAAPGQWLERYATGTLLLAPPTLMALRDLNENPETPTLSRLAQFGGDGTWNDPDGPARDTVSGTVGAGAGRGPRPTPSSGASPPPPPAPTSLRSGTVSGPIPEHEPLAGLRVLFVRSNTLPPAAHTNCFLVGDEGRPRLLIDPSPADEYEYRRLRRQAAGRFDAVFLTHHHPDHHERADALARQCAVPILCSADTHARIRARWPGFFDRIDVREVADGQAVTCWLGRAVHALAVPGHDAGQLALLPEDRAWCIVGDLIQGIGTVVIAPPEGDMGIYFATLERVIALDPAVILPSHGQALGGTYYLRAALKHRRVREEQILRLYRAGADENRMLVEIYAGTPAALLPLARVNIRSHLDKLAAEGRL
ncbi:MAG: MBL fold metallo-hydrolase [Gammaproteobacteria bacterium]|nr:MBL fold metallo-hydrolase [Gammaproteobacteria bacterium]